MLPKLQLKTNDEVWTSKPGANENI